MNHIRKKQAAAIREAQRGVRTTQSNWAVFVRENGNYYAKMAISDDHCRRDYLCTITPDDVDTLPLHIASNLSKYRISTEYKENR